LTAVCSCERPHARAHTPAGAHQTTRR
jgi:hypothetical protein